MSSEYVYNGMPASDLTVTWHKSSHSNPNGNCVELAQLPGGNVAVRNSRFPGGPALVFPARAAAAFLSAMGSGEFDDLAH
jgi:hypothetical protein